MQALGRPLVLASCLVIAALGAPVGAFHRDNLPVLAFGSGPGAGWISAAVTVPPGGEVAVDIRASSPSFPVQGGFAVLTPAGDVLGLLTFTLLSLDDGLRASATLPNGDEVVYGSLADGPALLFFTYGPTYQNVFGPTQSRVIVAWIAGDMPSHDWTLRATTGISLVSTRSGASAFLRTELDLDGGASAIAGTGGGHGARLVAAAGATLDVTGRFFGVFFVASGKVLCQAPSTHTDCTRVQGTDVPPVAHLAWTTPTGTVRGPAATTRGTFANAAPGAYTFTVDAFIDAGVDRAALRRCDGGQCTLAQMWNGHVVLGGADVVLATF